MSPTFTEKEKEKKTNKQKNQKNRNFFLVNKYLFA